MTLRIATLVLAWMAGLALIAAGPALAQDGGAAGRFIAVAGDVKVVGADGQTRAVRRGDSFRQGESIVTGANSLAQLRMTDGAALSVRAGTRIRLDQYRFHGADDPEPSFFASLIAGGFRTLTGLIGRSRRESYRVTTPSMTLGVRGTDFELVHVVQQRPGVAPGTYNRVYAGVTSFRNKTGVELLVTREQTAFVALAGNRPPVLVKPPEVIFGKPTPMPALKPQAREDDDGAQASKDRAAPRAREALRSAKEKAPALVSPREGVSVESPKTDVSPTTVAPLRSAPLLNPIDTPATISPKATLPALTSPTTISPTLTPLDAPATISPTLTAPKTDTVSPTLTAPAVPRLESVAPALTAPATTISPVLTAPKTTISPVLTAPVQTAPVQTAPTLTQPLQTAPTLKQPLQTSPIIKR